MIRSIIGSSIKYQFLVITIAIALIIFGITQFAKMPVDILPEFSPPYVEIQTEALGLSAKEVEQLITIPMEQDLLAGVAWLDVIHSESVPGLSSVLVYFEPGTDLYQARQMVTERISQAAVGLPNVSKPPTMIQPLSSASRFMIVGLSSDELSLIEMSVLARWTIAPKLMGVPGVAHVAIWGNRDRQLQVLVDPERLQAKGVSLNQIIETTGNALWVSPLSYLEASSPGTGGFIDTPNQRLTVWHVLPISSPAELAQVPVENADGLLLGDVAQVVEDHQPLIGDAVVNDQPNVLLVIEKLPDVNTLQVTQDVEQALDSLAPGLPGVQFDATLFRPASYLDMATDNLGRSLIAASLLILFALGIFFHGWRTALVSFLAIGVSLFAAMFVLYVRGETLNVMVFTGLVIALLIVIDDAVVDVENIISRLQRNRGMGEPISTGDAIQAALVEMRSASIFATLVILLTALPIFFINGTAGSLLRPMAVSYVLAVLASMLAALTVTPALSFLLLSRRQLNIREAPLFSRMQNGYENALLRVLKNPWIAAVGIVVLLVAGGTLLASLNLDQLLPGFREPYLTIKLESAPGTSRPEMDRIVSRISNEIRAVPGVRNVGAHIGRAVFGDQVVGINSAELWVSIDPQADYDSTTAAIQGAMQDYSGIVRNVQTYTQQILNPPQRIDGNDDVTLRVYGEDIQTLRAEAGKLKDFLGDIDGVVDAHVATTAEEPTIEIEVDLAAAQSYGIKPGDVRRATATLLSGIMVGNLFEEQKIFDVVVWGTPEIRDSISDVSNLPIQTPGGSQIRLGDVAKVRFVPSQTVILHDALSSYVDVGFTVNEREAGQVVRDIQTRLQGYAFPLEYHAEVLSNSLERQANWQRMLIICLIVAAGMYLLLQAAIRSWSMAFATLLLLFAALSGGIIAAFLVNNTLSIAALFGLLPVLGIAARNSTMMIGRYQHLESEEDKPFSRELVLLGSRERVTPIVITVLVTGLFLLPIAASGNIPGHEVLFPAAVVMLGGMLTSTLLNLFALPALYLRFGAAREKELEFQRTDIPVAVSHG